MSVERRRVLYSGRVQGVGFRATTRDLASGFEVRGNVRNLPDGRVEVVVEGKSDQIEAFLDALNREFRANIRGVAVEQATADPPLTGGFSVHY
jgi:acylphosphatase